jgi:ketosteroid isomerase-like protein
MSPITAASHAQEQAAHQAHEAYTSAINSNDVDSILELLTDDVVFLAAHAPPMIGKADLRQWLEGYVGAFQTHWDKTVEELVVTGEWAFERYHYHSTDTPREGGAPVEDTGWGLIVYHYDPDGKWRVARDAFGTDQPLPTG